MKYPLFLLLLLACTSDNIKATTKRNSFFEEMQNLFDTLKNNSPLSLNELDDKVELSIELPDNFPADDTTIDIKDNRSFKVTIKKNNDTLIVNGLQQGSSLVVNSSIQQESTQEDKDKNSSAQSSQKSLSSSSLQQLVLSRLDFKDLTVEHDEETNSLIISIPKIADPNTKSIKTAISKRKKQENNHATK